VFDQRLVCDMIVELAVTLRETYLKYDNIHLFILQIIHVNIHLNVAGEQIICDVRYKRKVFQNVYVSDLLWKNSFCERYS